VHFVHYSSDYLSVGEAVGAWDALSEDDSMDMHTLGVVGFLFEEVDERRANAEYNEAADAVLLQFVEDSEMKEVWSDDSASATLSFSITDLVAADDFMQNYYHYWGSLTTPPCTPAVSWHLAQNTIKVRHSTMEQFRNLTALWTHSGGEVDATTNYRPVQSNPSCISQCASSTEYDYCPEGSGASGDESTSDSSSTAVAVIVVVIVVILLVFVALFVFKEKKKERADTDTKMVASADCQPTHPTLPQMVTSASMNSVAGSQDGTTAK